MSRAGMSSTRRSTSTSKRLLAGLVTGLATFALLIGCASSSSTDQGAEIAPQELAQQEIAPQEQAAEDGEAAASTQSVAERDIITTTSADLRVDDVPGSVGALEQLVTQHEGRVEARTERTNDAVPEASLTIRIPADQNDAFLAALKDLGEVMQLESTAQDVTLERVDLESRISSLQSSIASLESMLEQATNVEDMLEIERELADRQAELQSLEAQLEVLAEDIAMSTVYVTLSTDQAPQPIDEPSGFFGGLSEGWEDFLESLNDFITDLGYAIPGLLLLLVILTALWFLIGRRIWMRVRRRAATETPEGAETRETER